MEEHSQIITVYFPADFEKEFDNFKEYITNDERFNKYKLTKKEQYVSLALRILIKNYNKNRSDYYLESAKKHEEKKTNTTNKESG